MSEKLRIGIIGTGSVGKVISTLLANDGYDVECLDFNKDFKKEFKGNVQNSFVPIDVVGQFGTHSSFIKYANQKFTSSKHIIILLTKAYNTVKAAKIAKQFLEPKGFVITLCNTHTIDELFKIIPKNKVVGLFIEWACLGTNDNLNRVVSKGANVIGVFDKDATSYFDIVKRIFNTISPTRIEKDMLGFITSRYIMNSAITGIGAISGLRLGKVLESRKSRKLFFYLIKESYEVCQKLGIKVPMYNHQLDYNCFCGDTFKNKMYRRKILNTIKIRNGNIMSSTLKALEENTKTEIDYIMGKFVKYGRNLGLKMPYNKIVYEMIKDIEDGEHSINPENLELAFNLKYDD